MKHHKPATKALAVEQAAPVPEKAVAAAAAASTSNASYETESAPVAQTGLSEKNKPAVTHEQIARLAYSYWAARGYAPGSPEQDWLRAERELKAKL